MKVISKKQFSKIISFVLIVAMALTLVSCKSGNNNEPANISSDVPEVSVKTVGEGSKTFEFSVTDKNGKTSDFLVKTDERTVGDALQKAGLISGDKSEYGLYIKTVNGITADYDTSKTYWAFYENGKYASKGADQTEIVSGVKYELKIEK